MQCSIETYLKISRALQEIGLKRLTPEAHNAIIYLAQQIDIELNINPNVTIAAGPLTESLKNN